MSNNKARKQSYQAVLADVKQEMTQLRVAESDRIETQRQFSATVEEPAKS
jgi:hypothetical protein